MEYEAINLFWWLDKDEIPTKEDFERYNSERVDFKMIGIDELTKKRLRKDEEFTLHS